MGKSKKAKIEVKDEVDDVEMNTTANTTADSKSIKTEPSTDKDDYNAYMEFVNPIAQPMAPRKIAKKVYKLIKKSSKEKQHLRQGIVDVQRALRKKETGIVILAGDVTPVDIYAHIAGMCEEAGLPYCYTPSKADLGMACGWYKWVTLNEGRNEVVCPYARCTLRGYCQSGDEFEGHRRPSIMCMIKPHDDYKELYDELHSTVNDLPIPR